MRSDHQIQSRTADFVSAKTTRPIPHAASIIGDALVQATLDPAVLEIGYLQPPETQSGPVGYGIITLLRRDGPRFLDIEAARPLRTHAEAHAVKNALSRLGFVPLVLTGQDIMREPRFSTARAVWSYRNFTVLPGVRFRLLATLAQDGPMSLHDLCSSVPGPQDPFSAVLSLACANQVEINLSESLGPSTTVKSRE